MKKKFIKGFFLVTLLLVAMGSFVSCKDSDEDAIAELKAELQNQNATLKQLIDAQVKTLQDQISALEAAKNACQTQCNEIKDRLSKLEGNYAELSATYEKQIKELQAAIAKLDGVLDAIEALKKTDADLAQQINDVNKVAAKAAADATLALELAQRNGVEITNLKVIVENIQSTIVGWGERLTAVEIAAAKAQSTADLAKQLAEEVKEILENMGEESSLSLAEAKKYTDDAIAALKGGATCTLGELQSAFYSYCASNNQRLSSLESRVSTLESQMRQVMSDFGILVEQLNEAISSIIVQGTVNQLIGYMNMPLDIRSTMLAAFCGEAGSTTNIGFPSKNKNLYVNPNQCPDTAERTFLQNNGAAFNDIWSIASAGGYVYDFEKDNKEQGAYAGTLYLTINPSSVNYNGTLKLMDSQDNESAMKLYSLQPSDYKLTFGWTKSADNGFYEAKAYVKEADIPSLAARIDFNSIKNSAKDLLDYKNGVNLTQLATTIYSTFSNVLDAYAVKAEYNMLEKEGSNYVLKPRSVYSNYNLALTTIKPLSYKFTIGEDGFEIPRIATIDDVIIEFDYDVNIDINVNQTTVPVSGTVIIPEREVDDNNGGTITVPGQTVSFSTTADLTNILRDLTNDISGQMNDQVENMLSELQNQVNGKINNYLSKANNVINKVNGVLDRFENFVQNIDSKLQPVLLFADANNNYLKLNEVYNVPTKMQLSGAGDNAAKLVATSYTAELLAPACKKLVCVSNVIRYENGVKKTAQNGDQSCLAAMNYANGKGLLGSVVSGTVRDFGFVTKAAYAGYIYEISYFALDFSGNQSRTKYYIQPVR